MNKNGNKKIIAKTVSEVETEFNIDEICNALTNSNIGVTVEFLEVLFNKLKSKNLCLHFVAQLIETRKRSELEFIEDLHTYINLYTAVKTVPNDILINLLSINKGIFSDDTGL